MKKSGGLIARRERRTLRRGVDGTGWLDLADVRSLQPLGALAHLELDLVPLDQALEALGLDSAEVDEHVLAILLGDEAIPLRIVEPLHMTLRHLSTTSFSRPSPL